MSTFVLVDLFIGRLTGLWCAPAQQSIGIFPVATIANVVYLFGWRMPINASVSIP
jgi:hypothetical protein